MTDGGQMLDNWDRRFVSQVDVTDRVPVHLVWELTQACDQSCAHCGSRSGRRGRNELDTRTILGTLPRLAKLGVREITLIGGEAYLRRDWLEIVGAITDAGIACGLQTGGLNLKAEAIEAAAGAGLRTVGVSLDGLPPTHDRLRGVVGSFNRAVGVLRLANRLGLGTSVTTQINRMTAPELEAMLEPIASADARNWMVQFTVPMGRAADRPELLVQPWEVPTILERLALLFMAGLARGVVLQPGNNVGYFGPGEWLLRGSGRPGSYYSGCKAGVCAASIEADGTVKGCPSLPTREYRAGTLRERPFDEIWRDASILQLFVGDRKDELWGVCAGCRFRQRCVAGCSWTAHCIKGRRGDNPYCDHRARKLARNGITETLVAIEAAPGRAFDHGILESRYRDAAGNDIPLPADLNEIAIPADDPLQQCFECGGFSATTDQHCRDCEAPFAVPLAPEARDQAGKNGYH